MLSLNYSDKCCSIQSAPQNSDVPKVDAVRELQILGSVNTPHSAICQENVANLRSQGNIVSVNDSSFCSASARSGRSFSTQCFFPIRAEALNNSVLGNLRKMSLLYVVYHYSFGSTINVCTSSTQREQKPFSRATSFASPKPEE